MNFGSDGGAPTRQWAADSGAGSRWRSDSGDRPQFGPDSAAERRAKKRDKGDEGLLKRVCDRLRFFSVHMPGDVTVDTFGEALDKAIQEAGRGPQEAPRAMLMGTAAAKANARQMRRAIARAASSVSTR